MKLKLDLHVHTTRSPDAFTRPNQLPIIAKSRGLDGLAITDHNQTTSDLPSGLTVIPGIEVSSKDGHVIGLGIAAPVPRGLSADITIAEIHRLKGVAIIPHPYDLFRSSVNPEKLQARPDAIEVVNSSSFLHSLTWKKASQFAERSKLPRVAGSDSHIPQTVGRAFTVVDSESTEIESVLDAIRDGAVSPVGRPIRATERLRKMLLGQRRSQFLSIW